MNKRLFPILMLVSLFLTGFSLPLFSPSSIVDNERISSVDTLSLTPTPTGDEFNISQTLSDEAQRNTIAFDGLAFLTGNLGADSFFPPGKVADFWGFQYLRDNDPTEMGHNTDFLTKAAYNMLYILTPEQRAQLIMLAQSQVSSINQYATNRFILIKAFRRLKEGDLPEDSTGLNQDAVEAYSAELYRLDIRISYERAQVMGAMIRNFTTDQRAYLDAMVGQGMLNWPNVGEPEDLQGLDHDAKVAVMTYAGDMLSWYVGSIEADVYFCPERQGTYFGSFYMKDAPAVGNPGYNISTSLTADMGKAFLNTLTPTQASIVTSLVNDQKPALYQIVDQRRNIAAQLRRFIAGETPDYVQLQALMDDYGKLDGEIAVRYATAFAQVNQTLTDAQRVELSTLRTQILGDLAFPSSAYLYAEPIPIPEIPNTDFLFTTLRPTATATATATLTATPTATPTSKTLTFTSVDANDGWVLESNEFSNVASQKNNGGALRVGDDSRNKQYRSLLYFDTASLPDKAVITKVVLSVKKLGTAGANPFATHGNLVADMKKGFFGLAPLELADFNAAGEPINSTSIFRTSDGGTWYQLTVNSLHFKYVNLYGTTQFRLRFTKDDDNDKIADFISFHPGGDAENSPQLIVTYTLR
jgi:hypothetical protein